MLGVRTCLRAAAFLALTVGLAGNLGCSGMSGKHGRPLEKPMAGERRDRGLMLQNARHVEGELTLLIRDIKVLKGDSLREDNQRKGLPRDLKPHLYVWSSQVVDRQNQRDAAEFDCSIPPTKVYWDKHNGNRIAFWDLTPLAQDGTTITLRRFIRYTAYETRFEIDPGKVEPYDRRSALYRFYTKSEPLIEVTDEIRALAHNIVGEEQNPCLKARKIFDWILENIRYKYPPAERGAIHCLHAREGDCGEYSFLFCALCRAEGIPARFVGGMWFAKQTGFHAWAEFYMPPYGWIPADTSHAQKRDGHHNYYYFGNLDNQRLIASVGTNLPIAPSPPWATYANSDVEAGMTSFMQHSTILMTGIEAQTPRLLHVTKVE
jgi:hypothetical protein